MITITDRDNDPLITITDIDNDPLITITDRDNDPLIAINRRYMLMCTRHVSGIAFSIYVQIWKVK